MKIKAAVAGAAIAMALLSPPQSATAHAFLLSSDPAAGSRLISWPAEISLEFNEELISIGEVKSNFVSVNNAEGDQISGDDEVITGSKITVSLNPNTVMGPVLVYYRVISADGHSIEGEYTFLNGEQAQTAEGVQNAEKNKSSSYLYAILFITSILFFGVYAYKRRKRV